MGLVSRLNERDLPSRLASQEGNPLPNCQSVYQTFLTLANFYLAFKAICCLSDFSWLALKTLIV